MILGFCPTGSYGDYYGEDVSFIHGDALITILVVCILCRGIGLCDLTEIEDNLVF